MLLAVRAANTRNHAKAELIRFRHHQARGFSRDEACHLGCSDGLLDRLARNGEVERVLPRVYRFTSAPP